jgi:nucleoside-diphosphate-sugar epimerase
MHALQGSGVQPVVLRIGSVWGPLMDPDSPFNPIPPYVSAALRGEQPPAVHAGDGGDTCYAADAGRAIALLTTAPALQHEVYNVSSGRPYTNRELSEAVRDAVPGTEPELLPGRHAGAGQNAYLDISRLAGETGFTPSFDLTAAVADYVAWRAGNPR